MKKVVEEKSETEESLDHLYAAMAAARKAFDKSLSDAGDEAAYYQLELKGFVLTRDFEKWKEITIKDAEEKKEAGEVE